VALTQPKSLILDVYGGFVRELGGWIAVADLIVLLDDLGVDEQAARSSISRMKRRGILERRQSAGIIGYALSERAQAILLDGDRRIFSTQEPANLEDGWAVVLFSVPEQEREKRHVLRSRLRWLGFGNAGAGVWIAPRRLLEEARETLARLELERYTELFEAHYRGFHDLHSMVERAWDLDELRRMYSDFLATQRPVLERWSRDDDTNDDRRAFIDYTLALSQWRKFPYLDPGLPAEMLPPDWEGRAAAALFFALAERTEKRGHRYVEQVVSGP
jgi:phenylacetic acid degradation operon negative regulatory protein